MGRYTADAVLERVAEMANNPASPGEHRLLEKVREIVAEVTDPRFDALEDRLEFNEQSVNARFDGIEKSVNARFDGIEHRLTMMDQHLAEILNRLPSK